ncbi:transcriptional repressor, partial [bacterium]|nr:transcriptional repressor [bacterium]
IITSLKTNNIKLTHTRIEILEYLIDNKNHPTADEIYNAIKKKYWTISKATIYSTLDLLEELGKIQKIIIGSSARYDWNTKPHHHFICRKCGNIYDIEQEFVNICPIINIVKKKGYKIENIKAYFYGLCPKCATKELKKEVE